jgi:hypothetical protein
MTGAQEAGWPGARDAGGLALFCVLLPELRGYAAVEGWQAELLAAVGELRAGSRPVTEVLEDFWRGLGLPGPTRADGPAGFEPVPGAEPAPPPRGAYLCPRGACGRVERRSPGGPLPECAVFDEPLAFG